MEAGSMDRKGKVSLQFNQEIYTPDDLGRRRLASFAVDDLFDISYGSAEPIGYSTELLQWTSTQVDVKLTFDNPFEVSRGRTNDQLRMRVANPGMFVAKSSGEPLAQDAVTEKEGMMVNMPRQLPEGVDEEEVQEQAETTKKAGTAIMIAQLVVQPLLKSGL
jgi:hypothetical protein